MKKGSLRKRFFRNLNSHILQRILTRGRTLPGMFPGLLVENTTLFARCEMDTPSRRLETIVKHLTNQILETSPTAAKGKIVSKLIAPR